MTTAEILLEDFDMEMGMTRRILDRVPDTIDANFKPHEKSMAFGYLAAHVAALPRFGILVLSTPSLNLATYKWPPLVFVSHDQLLADFDTLVAELRALIANASDSDLQYRWEFRFGDHILSNSPRSLACRHMCFNHLIHHRAQLGVYLRLNNIPIPGVYGPSADEPFKP